MFPLVSVCLGLSYENDEIIPGGHYLTRDEGVRDIQSKIALTQVHVK